MIALLSLTLLATLTAAAPAAALDTTVVLPFERTPGQRYSVTVEKLREEYETDAGRLLLIDRIRNEWLVDAEVRSRRPGGFSMAWTYRPSGTRRPPREPRYDPHTRTLTNVRVVFAADSVGRPLFVLNPLWVRSRLAEALETAWPVTEPEVRPLLSGVRRQVTTDDGLRRLVLSDPERLYFLSGRRLTIGEIVTSRTDMPNPFGQGRITADETIRLDSIDVASDVDHLTWTLTPDPTALARVVLDLLEGFAPGAVQETPAQLARRFRVSEHARFEIEMVRGFVLRADYERRVQAGDRVRVEETRLSTTPPIAY